MSLYQVLVTGAAYVEIEANNPSDAKKLASERLGEMRFGIWDMDLDFTCEDADLIEECDQ
jgi:hypothetical protein